MLHIVTIIIVKLTIHNSQVRIKVLNYLRECCVSNCNRACLLTDLTDQRSQNYGTNSFDILRERAY